MDFDEKRQSIVRRCKTGANYWSVFINVDGRALIGMHFTLSSFLLSGTVIHKFRINDKL